MYLYRVETNKQKHKDMTHSEMTTEIQNIATRLANGVNRWKQTGTELKNRVYSAIDMELDLMSFENDNARAMMHTVIVRTFAMNHPKQYRVVHPPVGMDQNGNWTTDESKWA